MADQSNTGGGKGSGSEWTNIFRQIELQVRREAAHLVGADEDADWRTIGKQTDEATRKGIAKTSSKPGRTQAINFFCVDNRFYMVDLPGYGYARVPLPVKRSWGKMVETYLRKRPNLKAVVVILDIRRDPNAGDRELLDWLRHFGIQAITVLTKADKLSRQQCMSRAKSIHGRLTEFTPEGPLIHSSKTREGREEIWEKIERVIDL